MNWREFVTPKDSSDSSQAEKSAALIEASKMNADDKKYLEDLQQTCAQKARG